MRFVLFSLLLVFLVSSVTSAAPQIDAIVSGSFNHGSTVSISGGGFGVKSPVAPVFWDDVENTYSSLNNGDTIPVGGSNEWKYNHNNLMKYNLDTQYGQSSANYRAYWDGSSNVPFFRKNGYFPDVFDRDHYITWNFRTETQLNYPENGNAQSTKLFRWWHHDNARTNKRDIVKTSRSEGVEGYIHPHEIDADCHHNDKNYAVGELNPDNWYRIEEFSRFGTGQNSDGLWKYWHHTGDNIILSQVQNWQTGYGCYWDNAPLRYLHQFGWAVTGAEPDWRPQKGNLYWDNLYIDNTQARIEIGNAPVFEDAIHREIQIPQNTWNENNIEFEVNMGSFTGNEDLYLFVVDESGVVSNGYPLSSDLPYITNVNSGSGLVDGSSYTIDGMNFGVKSPVEPIIWEDFESGVLNQRIDTGDSWDVITDNPDLEDQPIFSNDQAFSGSQSAKLTSIQVGAYGDPGYDYDYLWTNKLRFGNDPALDSDRAYVNFKIRHSIDLGNVGSFGTDTTPRMWKRWRISHFPNVDGDGRGSYGYPDVGSTWGSSGNNYFVRDGEGAIPFTSMHEGAITNPNVWHNEEVAVQYESSFGANDAKLKLWLNNKLEREKENFPFMFEPDETSLGFFRLTANMLSNYHEDRSVYYDNTYVDDTWARIMICDQPVWDDSVERHCEIQIPRTGWDDGTGRNIGFEVNLGSFTGSEDLYLYVVDENGDVSQGFALDSVPVCKNDNILNVGEQCDDGNFNDNDGCNSQCEFAVPTNNQVHWIDQNNPSCNDNSDGMSAPWCSLVPINSHLFNPGDSIVFREGTYNRYDLAHTGYGTSFSTRDAEISDSGTANNPIVVMGYPGESVVLQTEYHPEGGNLYGFSVIGSLEADHVIFQGLSIEGTLSFAESDYNIVRGCSFHGITAPDGESWTGNYAGLHNVGSRYSLVRNNYFENYRGDGDGNNGGYIVWGYSTVSVDPNNVAENNLFVNNDKGIYDKDNSRNNHYRKNIFENNAIALGIGGQWNCYNNYAYRNLFVDNYKGTILVHGPDNFFYNNVFDNTQMLDHGTYAISSHESFYNNIFVSDENTKILKYVQRASTDDYDELDYVNYNLYYPFTEVWYRGSAESYSLSDWQTKGYDANSQETDPLFTDSQYHLGSNSPANSAGRYGEDLGLYPDGDESVVIGMSRLDSSLPQFYCGDGSCNGVETQVSCPSDCGSPPPVCDNDGFCDSGETLNNCPSDCGSVVECFVDLDCDDGVSCTSDSCTNDVCFNVPSVPFCSLSDGLELYLPFDNSVVDLSGRDRSFVSVDGGVSGYGISPVDGFSAYFSGGALDFGFWDLSGDSFTLSSWVRVDAATDSSGSRFVSKASSSSEADHFWMLGEFDNQWRARLKTGVGDTLGPVGSLLDDVWYHVVTVYDGSSWSLFVDGSLLLSKARTGDVAVDSSVPVFVGSNSDGYGLFRGALDDLRVYDRALSVAEVSDLYAFRGELPAEFCSDGVCNADEDYFSCPLDCDPTIQDFTNHVFNTLLDLVLFGRDFN